MSRPTRRRTIRANTAFYSVRVTLADARLQPLRLVAGMPAEVYVETPPRTLLGYLFKPLVEQFGRAFSER